MKVCEIFKSIQAESRYQGTPVIFIRTSGCTRACNFCDTKYHTKGNNLSIKEIVEAIKKSGMKTVVWTGGEPLLYINEINTIIDKLGYEYEHHLETNGDLIKDDKYILSNLLVFNYIAISPKCLETAKRVYNLIGKYSDNYDIKVVTDLVNVNIDLIKYATSLMPLTLYDEEKDKLIRQRVWEYCVNYNKHYSMRLHTIVHGKKRGV